jgi:hypothetical protein
VKTDSHDPAHRGEPLQPEDNVVRLPREYLGPREDLVQIGAPPADAAPPAPEDFWGEGSSDLQSALVGPPANEAAEAPTGGPPRWRKRPISWPARTPTVIATATAALILAVVVIAAIGGQLHGTPHPQVASLSDLPNGSNSSLSVMEGDARHPALNLARGRRAHDSGRRRAHAAHPRGSKGRRAATGKSTSPTLITSSSSSNTSATYGASSPVSPNSSQTVSSTPAQAASAQPAFGANGSLGPGRGSANTQ